MQVFYGKFYCANEIEQLEDYGSVQTLAVEKNTWNERRDDEHEW